MKFWTVTVKSKITGEFSELNLASDENQEKKKVKKDFLSVNPHYSSASLRRSKKPPRWILFEKDFDKKLQDRNKEKKCPQQKEAS